ncbi:zinc ribbon domain-containing protein [Actinomycetes bacterium KLBMP 9797]
MRTRRAVPMATCERCVPAEPGGEFCAQCGSFLGWQPTEGPVGPVKPGEPTPDPDPVPWGATPAPSAAEQEVVAVQPGQAVAARPTVRREPGDAGAGPAGMACPVCAAPNPLGRRFCRRCGAPLAERPARVARVPWWRRFWRWLTRQRPGGWGVLYRLVVIVVVAALLATVAYGALLLGRRATDAVRDRVAKAQPERPVAATASSQAAGHPAEAVADGLSNEYWAPQPTGAGQGQHVDLRFARPFRLLDVIVHTGISPQQDEFLTQARPAELELTAVTASGERVSTALRLADQAGPQTFHRVIGDVVSVRLTIRASYGAAPDRRTAIGEVEFFKRP